MCRCIAAEAPREFGAPQLGILNNLSELIVREIETACERAEQRLQSRKLLAAMDLYQDAFMLVDTTVHKWRILHLNLMAANEIGARLIPHARSLKGEVSCVLLERRRRCPKLLNCSAVWRQAARSKSCSSSTLTQAYLCPSQVVVPPLSKVFDCVGTKF